MNINRLLNQTIVYWAPGTLNGYGRPAFDAGVELVGRWQPKVEEFVSSGGEKETSSSILYFNEACTVPVINGRVYLGTLASLTVAQQSDPNAVSESEVVRKVGKSPSVNAAQLLAKIWTVE